MPHSPLRKQVNRNGTPLTSHHQIYRFTSFCSHILCHPSIYAPIRGQMIYFPTPYFFKVFVLEATPLSCLFSLIQSFPSLHIHASPSPIFKNKMPSKEPTFLSSQCSTYLLLFIAYLKELSVLIPLFFSYSLFNHSSLASYQSHQ